MKEADWRRSKETPRKGVDRTHTHTRSCGLHVDEFRWGSRHEASKRLDAVREESVLCRLEVAKLKSHQLLSHSLALAKHGEQGLGGNCKGALCIQQLGQVSLSLLFPLSTLGFFLVNLLFLEFAVLHAPPQQQPMTYGVRCMRTPVQCNAERTFST